VSGVPAARAGWRWAAAAAPIVLATAAAALDAPRPAPAPDERWADVTRFGARGDGVVDDTEAFRRAAATGKAIRVPRPRAHYRLTGTVRLRASIVGEGLPELRMDGATGEERFAMLAVIDHDGAALVIRGLRLNGQWDGAAAQGEWSHNVLVKGSRSVTIEGNVLERPYGDNILVGGEGNPRPSEDVLIQDNQLIGPRRCNIALISARGVVIRRNVLRKENDYVSAIDLEPNPTPEDAVHGVRIVDNRFHAPSAVAVMLFHFDHGYPADGLAGGDVTISGNTGRALRFLAQVGAWGRVTHSDNF
jgi:hypothetical protein